MRPGLEEGDMPGLAEPLGRHQPAQLIRRLKTELGLSEAQTTQLRPIVFQAMKRGIEAHAQLRVAQLEVAELLEAEPVDMAQVEAKLKESEGLRTRLRLNLIQAHEQAKAVLTPEQRQQLDQLHERMPGLRQLMDPEGLGAMGMMRQPPHGLRGPGRGGQMGQGRGPMMPMQGMLQQMADMMARMAEMQRHLLELMETPQPEQP